MPRRMSYLEDSSMMSTTGGGDTCHQITDACIGGQMSANLSNVDGVRIPARLINKARGIAVMTVIKGGFGLGVEFGTGLVVARLRHDERSWSAPSAIGLGGVSWGVLAGAQVSDHVFLLMTDRAVEMLANDKGSIQLGADLGVALGPLGRSVEGNIGVTGKSISPIYTYSLSKGLYAGLSLDGKIISTRHTVNEKFYGMDRINPRDLLTGKVPTPPAAQPLYDALKRCHVYSAHGGVSTSAINTPFRSRRPQILDDDSGSHTIDFSTPVATRDIPDNDPSDEYGYL
jgi:lipid-binding SYLF domain-containing protein